MDGEDRRAVLAAIATLPQRQREVFALKYYLDLSAASTAYLINPATRTKMAVWLPGLPSGRYASLAW